MEKKLMLSLVTTLPRQKAPKEDMLFFSFCPPRPGPQATAGSPRSSASPQALLPDTSSHFCGLLSTCTYQERYLQRS